jgi:hypothetical protein
LSDQIVVPAVVRASAPTVARLRKRYAVKIVAAMAEAPTSVAVDALLDCFQVIEAATGLKVVVLPHPRFTYPAGSFGPFPVQRGAMLAMSKLQLVVSHYSTALALPIKFHKPVLLLNAEIFRMRMGARSERQCLSDARQRVSGQSASFDVEDCVQYH